MTDTTPDAFTIPSATNVTPGASVTRTFTYQGTDTLSPFTVSGGDISFDNVTFAGSGYAPVAPSGSPKTAYCRGNAGPAGSTGSVIVNIGGVQATMSIQAQAAAGGATFFSVAPGKVIAVLDATDTATMFSDTAATTPISNGAAANAVLMKTPANPNGDPAWKLTPLAGTTAPVYGATAYNLGKAGGLSVVPGRTLSLRNKPFGGTKTITTLVAVSSTADGKVVAINRNDRGAGTSGDPDGNYIEIAGTDIHSSSPGLDNMYKTIRPDGSSLNDGNPNNIEFGADGTNRFIYYAGSNTPRESAATTGTYATNLDIAVNFDGAYNNDLVTPSRPNSGFTGVISVILILSAPLSASERTAMQALLLEKAGGLTQAITLKKFSSARTGAVAKDGFAWTMNDTSGIVAGDYLTMEPADASAYGTRDVGGCTPERNGANEADILSRTYSNYDNWIRALDTNKVYQPFTADAQFTGSRSGTTLTVTAMLPNSKGLNRPIGLGGFLNADTSTTVEEQLSGTPGGVGTYRTNKTGTLASQTCSVVGGGGYTAWDPNDFYRRYIQPRALVGLVMSVDSATQVTVDVAAKEAGTNRVVKQDNWKRLQDISGGDNQIIDFTANVGTFFTSRTWGVQSRKGWTIKGTSAFKIARARGTGSGVVHLLSCTDTTIRDFTLRCVRAETWAYVGDSFGGIGETLMHFACVNTRDINMRLEEPSGQALCMRNCNFAPVPKSLNLTIDIVRPVEQYLANWAINFVNCGAPCEVLDFTFRSDWLQPALECFQSNAAIARGVFTNGLSALNTATNCVWDVKYTVLPNSRNKTIFSPQAPESILMLDINGNVGASQGGDQASGGHKILADIDVQGWIDSEGNIPQGLGSAMPDIEFYGTFLPGTKDDGNRRGRFRSPVPKNPNSFISATGIRASGERINVHNIKVETYTLTGSVLNSSARPYIDFEDYAPARNTGRIVDTITDGATLSLSTVATMSGNVTGNAYAALP